MARAVRSGLKTETRRALPSPVTKFERGDLVDFCEPFGFCRVEDLPQPSRWPAGFDPDAAREVLRGQTFGGRVFSGDFVLLYRADWGGFMIPPTAKDKAAAKASKTVNAGWQSQRFLPRWAVRYHLKVLGVHTENLQRIGARDVEREGWFPLTVPGRGDGQTIGPPQKLYVHPEIVRLDSASGRVVLDIAAAGHGADPVAAFADYWDALRPRGAEGQRFADDPQVAVFWFQLLSARPDVLTVSTATEVSA
jgi:hypothetical protein